MKKNLLIAIVFLVALVPFASKAQSRAEIQSLRISVFTKTIGLTPAESKVFWPVYNQYLKEKDAIDAQRKSIRGTIGKGVRGLSDQQVAGLTQREVNLEMKQAELTKKYHEKFKKILPAKKVALIYQAEYAFKRELLKRIRNR